MNGIAQHVSVVVPTMDRSDFVLRLLRYLQATHFGGHLFVGDSSGPWHAEQLRAGLKAGDGSFHVEYRAYPGLSEPQVSARLIDLVPTPYTVWLADDDFVVPAAIQEYAAFLEEHPDYSVAHGVAVLVALAASGPHGPIAELCPYGALGDLADHSASQRLLAHLTTYSVTAFSVHRTAQMREAYQCLPTLPDKSFTELLPSCVAVIQGKVKRLQQFYLVRQTHDRRYLLPDLFDWVTSADWLPSYRIFQEELVKRLVQQDRVAVDKARSLVKQAFWSYLAKSLHNDWRHLYTAAPPSRLRQAARRVPGVRRIGRWVRAGLKYRKHELSLNALLSPASPYHEDFMPVYQAITQVPSNHPAQ